MSYPCEERRLLYTIACDAAKREGHSLNRWLDLVGVSRNAVYSSLGLPTMRTVYSICDRAGVKVSDFFKELGR